MKLGDVEEDLLKVLYEFEFNNGEVPRVMDFDFKEIDLTAKKSEAIHIIEKMEADGYLYLERKPFVEEGIEPKYKRNFSILNWGNVHITSKGKNYLKSALVI
ncbi:hypothetical protein ACM26V_07355 [Salipaludibacillus sp. HK11]|uniref:hypothetical protein n=1 Tax=Salipaludibacillus sp. HK11 TaxID=3394320 RepID=UPI0039FC1209